MRTCRCAIMLLPRKPPITTYLFWLNIEKANYTKIREFPTRDKEPTNFQTFSSNLCENGLIRIIHPQVFSGIHSQIIVLVKLQEKLLNFTKNKLHFRCSVNFTEFFIIVFSRTSPFNCFWLISEFSKTRESVLGTFLVT